MLPEGVKYIRDPNGMRESLGKKKYGGGKRAVVKLKFPWGKGGSTSHKSMLSMVSGGRPRWYVPLIKLEYHYTAYLGF